MDNSIEKVEHFGKTSRKEKELAVLFFSGM